MISQDPHRQRAGVETLALLVMAIFTVWVVWLGAEEYFRPYNDVYQSSLGSAHAHGMAYASLSSLNPLSLFFLAKHVGDAGFFEPYPHYTNGFPLFLRGWLELFGNSAFAGRAFALTLFLIGTVLFIRKIKDPGQRLIAYAAIPLTLATPAGRDSATFLLLEPAQLFVLGVASAVLLSDRWGRSWFARAGIILGCTSFYQVALPFVVWVSLVSFLRHRTFRVLVFDGMMVTVSILLVFLAFILSGPSFSEGVRALVEIILHRTAIDTSHLGYQEHIGFRQLLDILVIEIHRSFRAVLPWMFAVAAVGFLAGARDPLLWIPLGGFVMYALLLKNHVGFHDFTRFPLIFLALVLQLASAAAIVQRLIHNRRWRSGLLSAGALALVVFLVPTLRERPRQYALIPEVAAELARLEALESQYRTTLSQCGSLGIEGVTLGFRLPQFVFGPHFARMGGAAGEHSGPRCVINISTGSISGVTP